MTFAQNVRVLKGRLRLAVTVGVIFLGVVAVVTFLWPKTYTATASVLVDVKVGDPVSGESLGRTLPPQVLQSYLATEIQMILSDRAIGKAIKALSLDADPHERAQWLAATRGAGSFDAWLANELRKSLLVKPSHDSHVINISYSARSAKAAAQFANALAQAALATDLELKLVPARESSAFFDERAEAARQQLEKAQQALSDYERKTGVTATDDKLDIENSRLNELSSQLAAIQGVAIESGSRATEAQRGGGVLPEVLANPVVQGLRSALADKEAKLRELGSRLGVNHPQYQQAESEVRELRARLEQETTRMEHGVGSANRVNRSRETQIRAALAAQKTKVLALKGQKDKATMLAREVENAQKAYDEVAQHRTRTNLASRDNVTDLSILSPATEPGRHSSPERGLILLLAAMVAGLVGLVSAFSYESVDRRVRSVDDLATIARPPLLAVVKDSSGQRPAYGRQPLLPGPARG